jgi:hypothetical protein
MSAELLWTRKTRKKHYETYHVSCSTTGLTICPLTYLYTRYQPRLLTRSAGCTECPQKIHFQNDTENKSGVLTNSYFLLSIGGRFIFILCEPGLCYCALLPPDATNFESGYRITIFMYTFIMYFYNISLKLQLRFVFIF